MQVHVSFLFMVWWKQHFPNVDKARINGQAEWIATSGRSEIGPPERITLLFLYLLQRLFSDSIFLAFERSSTVCCRFCGFVIYDAAFCEDLKRATFFSLFFTDC